MRRRSLSLAMVAAFAATPFLSTPASAAEVDRSVAATLYAGGNGGSAVALVNPYPENYVLVSGDSGTTTTNVTNGAAREGRLKWGYFEVTAANIANSTFGEDFKMQLEQDGVVTLNDAVANYLGEDTFTEVGSKEVAANSAASFTWDWSYNATEVTPPSNASANVFLGAVLYAIENPTAPTVNDLAGKENDTITVPADTDCVEYGDPVYADGTWSVGAQATDLCEFEDGTRTRLLSGAFAPPAIPAVAKAVGVPNVTDSSGENDRVTAPPSQEGVTYTAPKKTDEKQGFNSVWTFTATATEGYLLSVPTNLPSNVTVTLNPEKTVATYRVLTSNLANVTGYQQPKVTDVPGYLKDSVTFAPAGTVNNITYEAGVYNQSTGVYSQVLRTADGYVFAPTGHPAGSTLNAERTVLTLNGKLDATPRIASATTPKVTDEVGTARDAVVAPPNNADVSYKLDYDRVTGKWTLVATATAADVVLSPPKGENVVVGDAGRTVTMTGTLDVKEEPKLATPVAAAILDLPGSAGDEVIVPNNADGVTYKLDYDQRTGKWTLTATADEGYEFEGGKTTVITSGTLNVDGTPVPNTPDSDDDGDNDNTNTGGDDYVSTPSDILDNTSYPNNVSLPLPGTVTTTLGTTGTPGTLGVVGTTTTNPTVTPVAINSGEQAASVSWLQAAAGSLLGALGLGLFGYTSRRNRKALRKV